MITIKNITQFLTKKYPLKKAESWDNVGLINGNLLKKITNILVVLDLTTESFDYAIKRKCDLIITHHPFLFEKTWQEEFIKCPYKKNLYKRIINNEIGLLVLHTNFDNSKDGSAMQIVKILNFKNWKFLDHSYYGIIIETNFKLEKIFQLINQKMQISNFKTNFDVKSNFAFNKIAFLPGSGNPEDIISAHQEGASIIFTSDIKWSTWITAKEHNIKLIDYSHSIENVFTQKIIEIINKKYKKINVFGYKILINNYLIGIKRERND